MAKKAAPIWADGLAGEAPAGAFCPRPDIGGFHLAAGWRDAYIGALGRWIRAEPRFPIARSRYVIFYQEGEGPQPFPIPV